MSDNLTLARDAAKERGWASTSLLQRVLCVGFAEASRLLDELSAEGTIEHSTNGKSRLLKSEHGHDS